LTAGVAQCPGGSSERVLVLLRQKLMGSNIW